ncbi:MAG: hypothetical protein K6U80_09825 [Firmicutes bacterium]|nr:hypothetical protein [Bacillota bacterium]
MTKGYDPNLALKEIGTTISHLGVKKQIPSCGSFCGAPPPLGVCEKSERLYPKTVAGQKGLWLSPEALQDKEIDIVEKLYVNQKFNYRDIHADRDIVWFFVSGILHDLLVHYQ